MTAATRSSASHKTSLGKEFKAVGLNPKSTFDAMPDWWQDAIVEPSGICEIKGFVAKYFGLEIGPDGVLRRRSLPPACFKTRSGTDVSTLAPARALATAVDRMVASVTPDRFRMPTKVASFFLSNSSSLMSPMIRMHLRPM